MKRKTIALTTVLTIVMGVVALSIFFTTSEAVSETGFAQVADGMTEAQVREVLGVPHYVRHDAPNQTAFFYGGFQRLKWCSMEVFFGADGRVIGKFHDH